MVSENLFFLHPSSLSVPAVLCPRLISALQLGFFQLDDGKSRSPAGAAGCISFGRGDQSRLSEHRSPPKNVDGGNHKGRYRSWSRLQNLQEASQR